MAFRICDLPPICRKVTSVMLHPDCEFIEASRLSTDVEGSQQVTHTESVNHNVLQSLSHQQGVFSHKAWKKGPPPKGLPNLLSMVSPLARP